MSALRVLIYSQAVAHANEQRKGLRSSRQAASSILLCCGGERMICYRVVALEFVPLFGTIGMTNDAMPRRAMLPP